ncbi:MAG: ABC transporter permease subunit [Planctomycetota bacterium]|nr:ABC transporter permease subunit [Planctomycetota bacterium]
MKIFREAWLATLLFSIAFLIVEILLNMILPLLLEQMGDMLDRLPFIKDFLGALLGIELEGEITAQIMQAFVWVHPVVLTLLWAHEIIFCTRFPAGEIDRGTIDILLGLPVSRRQVYFAHTIGWLASGLVIFGFGTIGYTLGSIDMPTENRPAFMSIIRVLMNLFCVYIAVGGLAFLCSSMCERRGKAIAIIFGLVLCSFLINFLAQFWPPAEPFAVLSVLNYYQPAIILKSGSLVFGDIAILLAVGVVGWTLGLEITARRSICTT